VNPFKRQLHPPLTNASGDAGDGLLLVAGGLTPWHNPFDALDVNGDGPVTPLDAVIVINRLNAEAAGDAPASVAYYDDINDDSLCTAQDVLIVINYLNTQALPAAEGKGRRFASLLLDDRWFAAGPRRAALTGVGEPAPESLDGRSFAELERGLSSLEEVLSDCVDDIASA
jgi:hypothetical protein